MERGLGPITTRKVKTLRGSGLRTIQPRITFPHLNPTLHGPSMTNVIGNLPYLDQTAKILMIGMKKPNHGTKPKLKKFLQSASHFVRKASRSKSAGLRSYQTKAIGFSQFKKTSPNSRYDAHRDTPRHARFQKCR
jgi:hypothetical protein